MAGMLDEVLERFTSLPAKEQEELERLANEATKDMLWVPNPGPQTEAYYCEAEQMLYGGEAGGGKSDILVGLGLQEHSRSLILRRVNKDVDWLVDRIFEIRDTRDGYNGQNHRFTLPNDRIIDVGGCQHPGDEQRYKGRPKDFIGFDEASDFAESQVAFIIGWLRSTKKNQRKRVVFATNPPTTAEGEWLIDWFGPWVNPEHPLYPTEPGVILWCARDKDDRWIWFDKPDAVMVDGRMVAPISRTFIRAGLDDNPDLARTDYRRQLDAMPEALRARYGRGEFVGRQEDDVWQVMPTAWIDAAQARWTSNPPPQTAMTALGVDVAQGGKDRTAMAPRYATWFGPVVVKPGVDTPDGASIAGLVVQHMRDGSQINIDLGGGWGNSAYEWIKDELELSVLGVNPSEGTDARTVDGRHGFLNKRAEIVWRMREALDPNSADPIALPPDRELKADLAAFRYKLTRSGYQIESKDEMKKRLGRSPDKGDAVILANYSGKSRVQARRATSRHGARPTHANVGHAHAKNKYRRNGRQSGPGQQPLPREDG